MKILQVERMEILLRDVKISARRLKGMPSQAKKLKGFLLKARKNAEEIKNILLDIHKNTDKLMKAEQLVLKEIKRPKRIFRKSLAEAYITLHKKIQKEIKNNLKERKEKNLTAPCLQKIDGICKDIDHFIYWVDNTFKESEKMISYRLYDKAANHYETISDYLFKTVNSIDKGIIPLLRKDTMALNIYRKQLDEKLKQAKKELADKERERKEAA